MSFSKPGTKHERFKNLSRKILQEHIVAYNQGERTSSGAINIMTGKFTGRSPLDKFIVSDKITEGRVDWGSINQKISIKHFNQLKRKLLSFMDNQDLYIQEGYACADSRYRLKVCLKATHAYSALFVSNMFLRPSEDELKGFIADWKIYCAPEFKADPKADGTRQENFTVVNFTNREVLIGGSGYTGEIKKSIFSVLNFNLPINDQVLPMHCSANIGKHGDTSIFFGLSGTGKTTLSTENARRLIGDDEHGWSDFGIFNFEGGCYAKCANLSEASEPEIFAAIKEGALLENLKLDASGNPKFDDLSITQNTRVSYPIYHIENSKSDSKGGIPSNIFFLACDAFGVLPPLSRLTNEQAMYHFISGYTAKIAGTEEGINEPVANFSACFGAPFLPLNPVKYAEMLGEKIEKHDVSVWLVNTGWYGGQYGEGERIPLKYTRRLIEAVHSGELEEAEYDNYGAFNLQVPINIKGVPKEMLNPKRGWSDPVKYDTMESHLIKLYAQNIRKYKLGSSLKRIVEIQNNPILA